MQRGIVANFRACAGATQSTVSVLNRFSPKIFAIRAGKNFLYPERLKHDKMPAAGTAETEADLQRLNRASLDHTCNQPWASLLELDHGFSFTPETDPITPFSRG